MSLKVRILDSPAALRAASQTWDALWWRAAASLPTLRAETAAQWSEQFASGRLAAVCIEQEGCFVAALALVPLRFKRMVPALGPASGIWSRCGDLLLDPEAEVQAVCDLLLHALLGLHAPLVWCDAVPYGQAGWQALRDAAVDQHHWCLRMDQSPVGQVSLQHDWNEYFRSRSSSFRRAMRRAEQRAAQARGVELAWYEEPSAQQAEHLVRVAFELEHLGWKGRRGGSVLSVPGLVHFFQRQARQLAEWKQVRFAFLMHAGQPIAFEYAPCAKGVYHAVKVGYDEAWHELSPGQLLRHRAYQRLFADRSLRAIDFSGPLTHATARWATHIEPRGCLLLPTSLAGRVMVSLYRALRPLVQCTRRATPSHTEHVRPVPPLQMAPHR